MADGMGPRLEKARYGLVMVPKCTERKFPCCFGSCSWERSSTCAQSSKA